MTRSGEARTLWRAALRLDRAARTVSGPVGMGRRRRPPLLFFTDPIRTPEPWITAARLPFGAGVVYRSFGAEDAERVARRLRDVTRERGVRLLIGRDADLAACVGADGVHLPEAALGDATDLRAVYPDWLLTAALHDPAGASRMGSDLTAWGASLDALDALVLSPIFPAGGSSSTKAALGVEALDIAARRTGRPIYALGGVSVQTVEALAGSGACGLAGVAAVAQAFGSSKGLSLSLRT